MVAQSRLQKTSGCEPARRHADWNPDELQTAVLSHAVGQFDILHKPPRLVATASMKEFPPDEQALVAPGDGNSGAKIDLEIEQAPKPPLADIANGKSASEGFRIFERSFYQFPGAGRKAGIGVQEQKHVAVGLAGSRVHLQTAAPDVADDDRSGPGGDLRCAIGATSIGDNHFVAGPKRGPDRAFDLAGLVQGGNDD